MDINNKIELCLFLPNTAKQLYVNLVSIIPWVSMNKANRCDKYSPMCHVPQHKQRPPVIQSSTSDINPTFTSPYLTYGSHF